MSIIQDILRELAEGQLGQNIATYLEAPYKMIHGGSPNYKIESIKRSLSRAQEKGWIKRITDERKVYLALTKLGEKKLNSYSSKLSLKGEEKPWDGKYRLVMFDIPESNRILRNELRRSLKKFDFVGWQQSVWVTREAATGELRKFVRDNNLQDYILVIETDNLANSKLEKLLGK